MTVFADDDLGLDELRVDWLLGDAPRPWTKFLLHVMIRYDTNVPRPNGALALVN